MIKLIFDLFIRPMMGMFFDSGGPDLPPAPTFFEDPNVSSNIDRLTTLGEGLTSGRFLDPSSDVGFLNQLVTLNPEATQRAVELATRPLLEAQEISKRNTINQLAANNQLESSVTANRLADLDRQFSGDVGDISTNFFLADVNRSLSNIGSLFGTGINTTNTAANLGLSNQAQRNEFNLQNFQNEAALALANDEPSFLGSTVGSLAGGTLGFFVGGPAGAAAGAGLGGAGGSLFDSNRGASALPFLSTGANASGLFNTSGTAGTGISSSSANSPANFLLSSQNPELNTLARGIFGGSSGLRGFGF